MLKPLVCFYGVLFSIILISVAWVGHRTSSGLWPGGTRFWIATLAGTATLAVSLHYLRLSLLDGLGRKPISARQGLAVVLLILGGVALIVLFYSSRLAG